MKTSFDSQTLELTPSGEGFVARLDGRTVQVEVLRSADGRMDLRIDGRPVSAHVSADQAKRWVTIDGRTRLLQKSSGAKQGQRHDHAGGLTAPMPGQVRSLSARAGDEVKKGQTLLTLEAMKMEIRIQAHKDGRIAKVHVKQGETVEREQILIEMEE